MSSYSVKFENGRGEMDEMGGFHSFEDAEKFAKEMGGTLYEDGIRIWSI